MAEWLWDSFFLTWRIFVILSIFTVIGAVFSAIINWINGDGS